MTLPYEPESYRPSTNQPTDDQPPDTAAPAPTGERVPRFALFAACPKCGGQYEREGDLCMCFQCSFEWDVLPAASLHDPPEFFSDTPVEPAA